MFCNFTVFARDMNLIIDVGNTNVKLAVFNQEQIIDKHVVKIKYLKSSIKSITK